MSIRPIDWLKDFPLYVYIHIFALVTTQNDFEMNIVWKYENNNKVDC